MPTKSKRTLIYFAIIPALALACANQPDSVKGVMDEVVSRLYREFDEQELLSLNDEKIQQFITPWERQVLASKYWYFNVNVPVTVSVMRHNEQAVVPFWLPEAGFKKTAMVVKNEEYTYEVWQKRFDSGRVELGINGFDKHRPHYFVAMAPINPADSLLIDHCFPANQFITTMDLGAFTYHDWDELVLTEVPQSLKGAKLLTTIRGRAREAHLINAFRKTPFPSSAKPDQILLTWSDEPSTTQSVQWRTSTQTSTGVVRYWRAGDDADKFTEVPADRQVLEDRLLYNDRYIHRFTAKISQSAPATTYNYTVGSPTQNVWSDTLQFITAPKNDAPFSFVYFGDTHRSPHWGKLLHQAFARHPQTAFYTIGGDVVSTGLYRDDWDHLFAYSSPVFAQRPLMPALGNHDDQDGLGAWMFFDLFDLPHNGPASFEPERVYSFAYSNALFLVLDATSPVQPQADWLDRQLSNTQATWKFAIFHFPPYSYEEDYPEIRSKWGAMFDKYHMDMVMSGHVHYYMRSKPMFDQHPVASPAEGTIYVISIGIPNRGGEMPPRDFVAVRFGGEALYQLFEIGGKHLHYRALNLQGDVRDELVIDKK